MTLSLLWLAALPAAAMTAKGGPPAKAVVPVPAVSLVKAGPAAAGPAPAAAPQAVQTLGALGTEIARGADQERPLAQAFEGAAAPKADAVAAALGEPQGPLRPGRALQEKIWSERIVPSAYTGALPVSLPSGWKAGLKRLWTFVRMRRTFVEDGDVLPPSHGPFKLLHPFGSVLKAAYNARPGHAFTGLFAESGVPGLIRLSLAVPPTNARFIPGAALKLFVDGGPSVNAVFLAGGRLEGQQPDRNFFSQAFTNVLSKPDSFAFKVGGFVLGLFNRFNSRNIPVAEFARVSSDGTVVENAKAPYQLFLKPVPGRGNPSDTAKDFREELAAQRPGALFEVHAVEKAGDAPIHIGDIVAESSPVASEYGDKGLFFRHRRLGR